MDGRVLKKFIFLPILIALIILPAQAGSEEIDLEDNAVCFECHEDFDAKRFDASVHEGACIDCHSDITEREHPEKLNKVDCAECHDDVVPLFEQSVHGRLREDEAKAAGCAACHGNVHRVMEQDDPESQINRMNVAHTCASCHEDAERMAPYGHLNIRPFSSYLKTIHGRALMEKQNADAATCSDCHGAHTVLPATDPASKMGRFLAPETCGGCHEEAYEQYELGIHGQAHAAGRKEAPTCLDCHGEHTILSISDPEADVYATSASEKVCARCHENESITSKFTMPGDSVKTFRDSYHGLASRFGVTKVANCASCHGAHKVLPSSDPESSIHLSQLAETCGQCHPNAGVRFTQGKIHVSADLQESPWVFIVKNLYILLIILVVGGMLFHNLLDFIKKAREAWKNKPAEEELFTLNERIQHVLLVISFVVLAYTGFALKHPDTWWAQPLIWISVEQDFRGIIHRIAALVFSVLAVYHALYMVFTRRGRQQVRALWPAVKDVKDVFGLLGYNLGIVKKRPELGHFSYIEKAEYWALVWGSFIMAFTGFLLTFENLALKFLPKWALDVVVTIHYYEALLATLAIIVWHFYFVIFDPDQYPLNRSMFRGSTDEKK